MKNNPISRCLILITVFLVPFYFFRFKILGIPTNILEVAIIVSALSAAFKRPFRPFGWWWWLPSAVAFIAAIIAPDTRVALGIFKGWFFLPTLFAWTIVQVFDATSYHRLRIPLLASATVVSLWAVLQNFGLIGTLFYQVGDASFNAYLEEGRAFGPFGSPNYLAMYLVPTIFTILSLSNARDKFLQKIVPYCGLGLMLVALIFSGSRGGGMALIAGLIVFSAARYTKLLNLKYLAAALTAIIALNLAYYFVAPRLQSSSGGDAIRQEILDYSLKLTRQNPLWGTGLGNFQSAIGEASTGHASFQSFALPFALHPHNLLLALYLNLGLAGLLAFLFIIYRVLKNLAAHPDGATLAAALTAILAHGLFDTTYFKNDLSVVFWLIVAISLIIPRYNSDKPKITPLGCD